MEDSVEFSLHSRMPSLIRQAYGASRVSGTSWCRFCKFHKRLAIAELKVTKRLGGSWLLCDKHVRRLVAYINRLEKQGKKIDLAAWKRDQEWKPE